MKTSAATYLLPALLIFTAPTQAETAEAIFAGGCFWCVESDFEKQPGVISAVSGYIGGELKNPDYKSVSQGSSGHYEAVRINYDPQVVSYQQLLDVFWRNIDPLDDLGQFCDKGSSYRSAVFVVDATQRKLAEQSRDQVQTTLGQDSPVVTPILAASTFYTAEDYHQDYYKKNPRRYQYYRWGCGRDQRLEALWGPAN
jgi:peptide-methionine (S)-S-oxide reductase